MEEHDLINKIKEKREFSGLPDSIVARILHESNEVDDKSKIKDVRSKLRKFFGVFLTNRVLKGNGEDILDSHISSKLRNYSEFYDKIFKSISNTKTLIDLGCGVNGFSYPEIKKALGNVKYLGIEATGQLVEKMNNYFKDEGYDATAICSDIYEYKETLDKIKEAKSPRVILMLQLIDALESMKKDFSKTFLVELFKILEKKDTVIITMPMSSISGRKRFEADRKWLRDFLEDNFNLVDEFIIGNERVFRVVK